MKRLVLHVGMEKTGTSTIQDSLGEQSQKLKGHGIVVPNWRPFNHSYDFTTLFMDDPKRSFLYKQSSPISDKGWSNLLGKNKKRWVRLFSAFKSGTCIVSAENLSVLSKREIERVLEFVNPHFDQVIAIAYVRNPQDSIRSRWEQRVKQIQEPRSGEEILVATKNAFSFRFIDRWVGALGSNNLRVRNFNHAITACDSLLHDFFHALDLPEHLADSMESQSSNTSLGREGAALMLAYNSKYPMYLDGKYNPDRGLARHVYIMYDAMRSVRSEKLKFEVRFNDKEALKINEEISIVNKLFPPDQQVDEIIPCERKTELPTPDSISVEYYIDLINELSLVIDGYRDQ